MGALKPHSAAAQPGPSTTALHIYPAGAQPRAPLPGGSTVGPIAVYGLVADLVLALVSHGAELAAYEKGSVELHWGPNGVQGRFHPLWAASVDANLRQHFTPGPVAPPQPRPHVWPPQPLPRQPAAPARNMRPARRGNPVQERGRQGLRISGTELPPWAHAHDHDEP